jgi:hypothetical protein
MGGQAREVGTGYLCKRDCQLNRYRYLRKKDDAWLSQIDELLAKRDSGG